jgi:hypothetical protein
MTGEKVNVIIRLDRVIQMQGQMAFALMDSLIKSENDRGKV